MPFKAIFIFFNSKSQDFIFKSQANFSKVNQFAFLVMLESHRF